MLIDPAGADVASVVGWLDDAGLEGAGSDGVGFDGDVLSVPIVTVDPGITTGVGVASWGSPPQAASHGDTAVNSTSAAVRRPHDMGRTVLAGARRVPRGRSTR